MKAGPRLRFAPSPTGYLHVGSARTALFNWLYARQTKGTLILRIEDTDEQRSLPEWVDAITSGMTWLGLDWDEGPYLQSERSELHRGAADRLLAGGHAYWCDCTRQQVEARTRANPTPGYDRHCRDLGLGPGPGRALRFRVPDRGATVVQDVVRGAPVFEHAKIEDFVILKSSGSAVFILANVVDDADMAVTHVVRGEDHLPNTPKYLLIWRALASGPEPVFAHLPLLVNERRQKLSKRRDPVFVERYREEGYLPEAMVNYLALLGWSPPHGKEILSREELVSSFSLEEVNNSPAFFDVRKLRHFNGEHIRALPVGEFVQRARPWLEPPLAPWPPERFEETAFRRMAPLVQERAFVLSDVGMVDFLFLGQPVMDGQAWERRVVRGTSALELLDAALAAYSAVPSWDAPELHSLTARLAEEHGLGLAKAQFPIRVAVTGRDVGPPLFESLEVLGQERTLERLRAARARLAPPAH
ncbi:MAG TPA: glutamate--tRNA ligase [Acidimicrobiales bacterium]|nr:glutamate--tRNA ligase [Acidimicrobiales bacterium]